jgi:hypothetical protein
VKSRVSDYDGNDKIDYLKFSLAVSCPPRNPGIKDSPRYGPVRHQNAPRLMINPISHRAVENSE